MTTVKLLIVFTWFASIKVSGSEIGGRRCKFRFLNTHILDALEIAVQTTEFTTYYY